MPEGDTIHRLAAQLGRFLVGEVLERVVVRGIPRGPIGRRVTAVTATGKHLVIATDDGSEIRTHLGLNGHWRRHDPGEPVGGDRISVVLATARDALVCTSASTVEVTDRRAPGRGMAVSRLGPDLLAPDVDLAVVMDRVADQPATRLIGAVLLDQQIAAGIGNIWRCEALYATGIDPRTPVGDLDPDDVEQIYATARDLMRASVDHNDRTLDHAVFHRAGQACRRCGVLVIAILIEDRHAFACPRCQPHPRV